MAYHLKINSEILDPLNSGARIWDIDIQLTQPLTAFIDRGDYLASWLMNYLRGRDGLMVLCSDTIPTHPTRQIDAILSWNRFAACSDRPVILATDQPMIISSLRRDQVYMVENLDGRVTTTQLDMDPRLMTAGKIIRVLGAECPPDPVFVKVKRYEYMALTPYRTDDEHDKMLVLATELRELGIDRIVNPVERESDFVGIDDPIKKCNP